MDRELKNGNSSSFLSINNNNEESPRKPQGGGGNSDRLKRDEWSEGAVSSLLEAYEAKWTLRNRAKLKGQDWEDVAKHVSSRANSTKSLKTQTQCKNKIESMKKRYRSESAAADASSWPLYPRLDLLLRGNAPPPPLSSSPQICHGPTFMFLETSLPQELPQPTPTVPPPPLPPPLPPAPTTVLQPGNLVQNSHGSNGLDRSAKEDGVADKLSDHESDKNRMETDSSTPGPCSGQEKLKSKNLKMKMGRKNKRRGEERDIAESIRWLAEVVLRSEQSRMETMRELERIRAEADAKRGEMDLKRTEIIANTQLEIAKLFAGIGRGVDSSLKIGRS
ncbi:trihelix transcription factor ASIL2 [Olea europaea var. sylvestris]|uniref:trihelix transcription factor ASIL2 n=1 Tax=Olea europaea var. sylvestris TaxID=158386 RepID=UPI000C1D6DEC|nr:trihelix transcription factor ASIL2 [Olea europaea var. sylvestris]